MKTQGPKMMELNIGINVEDRRQIAADPLTQRMQIHEKNAWMHAKHAGLIT
jgi:DNA-binding ferritin-like protein